MHAQKQKNCRFSAVISGVPHGGVLEPQNSIGMYFFFFFYKSHPLINFRSGTFSAQFSLFCVFAAV